MTAPTINVNSVAPGAAVSGQAGAHGHGKAAAVGLEGFEAVFAAAFGAAAAGTGPTPAVSPKAAAVAAAPVVDADAEADADAQVPTEPQADVQDAAASGLAVDPTLALLAAPGKSGETPAADKPAGAEEATPPAWGRDKAKGAPAAPALANANPQARLAEKFAQPPDASDADPETPATDAAPVHPDKPARPPQAQAQAPAGGPRAGEPAAAPDAKAAAQADAPVVDALAVAAAQESEPPPAETPIALPQTASPIAQLAARAAPPGQPARGAPSTKTERGREPVETSSAAKSPGPQRPADPAADAPLDAARAADKETAEVSARAPQAADTPDASTLPTDAPQQAAGSAPTQHSAHTPVRGAPETVATLAAQIVKKLESRSTRFDLELNPAGLGKVDVRLEIGASGQISAAMTFDNPQAAAEVKARAAELQRALEQAGFNLSGGGMSFDVAGDRGQSQQGWQQASEQSGHGLRGRAFRDALNTAGDAADQAVSGALRLRRGLTSGLDVRI